MSTSDIIGVVKGTAGYLAPGQSDVSISGYVATNTSGGAKSVPLRTVSAGKSFIITDIHMSTDQAKASGYFHPQIMKNGVSVFDTIIHDLTPLTDVLETQLAGVAGDVFTLSLPQTTAAQNVAFRLGQVEY